MRKANNGRGFILLMVLLTVVAVMSIVASLALLNMSAARNTNRLDLGEVAYYAAETGVEDALMRIMRGAGNYSKEEILISGTGTTDPQKVSAWVTVQNGGAVNGVLGTPACSSTGRAVTSVGRYKHYIRMLRACISGTITYTIDSWVEIPFINDATYIPSNWYQ